MFDYKYRKAEYFRREFVGKRLKGIRRYRDDSGTQLDNVLTFVFCDRADVSIFVSHEMVFVYPGDVLQDDPFNLGLSYGEIKLGDFKELEGRVESVSCVFWDEYGNFIALLVEVIDLPTLLLIFQDDALTISSTRPELILDEIERQTHYSEPYSIL